MIVTQVVGAPQMPSVLPTQATELLQLIGGSPRVLAGTLLAGNKAATQAFSAGTGSERTLGHCDLCTLFHVQC